METKKQRAERLLARAWNYQTYEFCEEHVLTPNQVQALQAEFFMASMYNKPTKGLMAIWFLHQKAHDYLMIESDQADLWSHLRGYNINTLREENGKANDCRK